MFTQAITYHSEFTGSAPQSLELREAAALLDVCDLALMHPFANSRLHHRVSYDGIIHLSMRI